MSGHFLQTSACIFALVLLAAAWTDGRWRIIPNVLPLFLVVLFPIAAWGAGLDRGQVMLHLAVALGGFVLSVLLFRLGAWGGGDAKLVSAVLLWVGLAGLSRFLLVMTLAGGLLAVLLLVFWGRSARVPYGIAIAIAGLDWCGSAFSLVLTGAP